MIRAAFLRLFGPGRRYAGLSQPSDGPTIRRADAHPDAPPRRPLSIAELTRVAEELPTAPLVEQAIPRDLDTPLSALDPAAIPSVPRAPVRPVTPLAPGERLRTFPLVPSLPTETGAIVPGIDKLLRRLATG